jgi:hypothetical protein
MTNGPAPLLQRGVRVGEHESQATQGQRYGSARDAKHPFRPAVPAMHHLSRVRFRVQACVPESWQASKPRHLSMLHATGLLW